MRTFGGLTALVLALGAGPGCLAAPSPMETLVFAAPVEPTTAGPKTLVVMFPGLGDGPEDYATHGFVEGLQSRNRRVDVIAVGARLGHYQRRTFLKRVREDVFSRPEVSDYDEIWVVGISMGGLGAVLSAREFSDQVDGIVLLSPYLGKRKHAKAIAASGGLQAWAPPADASDNYSVELWRWLKLQTDGEGNDPEIYLGYGTEEGDVSHQVLDQALPRGRVIVGGSDHGWVTWVELWPALLERGAIG